MKVLDVVHFESTVTTLDFLGAQGLMGVYLIAGEVNFNGIDCFVVRDWDLVNDGTFIISKDYFTSSYVSVVDTIHSYQIDKFGRLKVDMVQ